LSHIYANVRSADDKIILIPYIFQADNTIRHFKDKHVLNQVTPSAWILTIDNGTIANDTFGALSPDSVLNDELVRSFDELGPDFEADGTLMKDD
jgi:hypothetical protein